MGILLSLSNALLIVFSQRLRLIGKRLNRVHARLKCLSCSQILFIEANTAWLRVGHRRYFVPLLPASDRAGSQLHWKLGQHETNPLRTNLIFGFIRYHDGRFRAA